MKWRERGRKRRMKIRFTAQQHARGGGGKKMCTKIGGKLCHVKLTYSLSPSLTLSRFSREFDFSLTALCCVCSPHFSDFPFFRSALSLSVCRWNFYRATLKLINELFSSPSPCVWPSFRFFFVSRHAVWGGDVDIDPAESDSRHTYRISSLSCAEISFTAALFFLFIIPIDILSLSIFSWSVHQSS